ncbi:Putative type-1 restriction enzyme MjaXP specificity protein [Planktothrix rubescens]|nr:Putative type-1 restriction enzyme MjaXP specificity protein [Planktothrix rubescens]
MSEWKEVQLKDVVSILGDGLHGTPEYSNDGDYYFINGNNFSQGSIVINDDTKRVSHSEYLKYKKELNDRTLFVSINGTLGNVAYYKGEKVVLGKSACYFNLLDNVDKRFIRYMLSTPYFKNYVQTYANGTTIKNVSLKSMREFPFKIPILLKEQKQIADIISCLDNKIDNLRRQNETLETIAQTLFKHWFIDFEFPNDDGKPYKSSGGAMVASELGDIPEGWRVGKLGEEVETVGGGTPSTTEPSYWENGDIYWYSPTDLTKSKTVFSLDTSKKITKLGLDKSSARLFPKYSILMTSRATIGEVTINTNYACTNQGFITLIPNSLFDTFYLFCWLKTQLTKVNLLASGSTFPELSKSDFRNFDFLIPSNHLVLGFRELVTPLFLRIETNTKQIQTLTKTRDALLPKLMSGQIRVKD